MVFFLMFSEKKLYMVFSVLIINFMRYEDTVHCAITVFLKMF